MEEQNGVNKEKDRNLQRQEAVTGRDKVGEGAIRKMGTLGERHLRKEGQRKRTEKRSIKTENTFSLLQEDAI